MPVPFPHTGYVEDAQRRVRVLFSGQYIVDTNKAKLVWVYSPGNAASLNMDDGADQTIF